MCSACPGCALAKPTKGNSSKSVYYFPIKAPFKVLHVDTYSASMHSGFEGSTSFLIGCCGMCSFGILELVTSTNASTFASAIMKMQLCFDFCHTVVLDKDNKFFSVCRESLYLLKINCHILSGDNHNPMLVERLCWYFNKGLHIMTVRGIGVIVNASLCMEFMPSSGYRHFLQSCGSRPRICFSYRLFHRNASRVNVISNYCQVSFPWPLQAPYHLLQDCNAISIWTPRLAMGTY